jgi:hypothetical protein
LGLWGLLSTAAMKIPWTRVAQSAPMLVDMIGKARTNMRMQEASAKNLDVQLKQLQDENAMLTSALLQVSDKLQLLTSRVSTLTKITGLSLLLAASALVLWLLK